VKLTCHCGTVALDLRLADRLTALRRCNCSFCRRRGAIAASVDLAELRVVRGTII